MIWGNPSTAALASTVLTFTWTELLHRVQEGSRKVKWTRRGIEHHNHNIWNPNLEKKNCINVDTCPWSHCILTYVKDLTSAERRVIIPGFSITVRQARTHTSIFYQAIGRSRTEESCDLGGEAHWLRTLHVSSSVVAILNDFLIFKSVARNILHLQPHWAFEQVHRLLIDVGPRRQWSSVSHMTSTEVFCWFQKIINWYSDCTSFFVHFFFYRCQAFFFFHCLIPQTQTNCSSLCHLFLTKDGTGQL